MTITRSANLTLERTPENIARVEAYLPSNYWVSPIRGWNDATPPVAVIKSAGADNAGWTLDGYVLPRLASGLIFGREEVTN